MRLSRRNPDLKFPPRVIRCNKQVGHNRIVASQRPSNSIHRDRSPVIDGFLAARIRRILTSNRKSMRPPTDHTTIGVLEHLAQRFGAVVPQQHHVGWERPRDAGRQKPGAGL